MTLMTLMTRRRAFLLLALAAATLCAAQSRTPQPHSPAAALYTIAGTLTDSISGDPVPRATVTLIAEDHETVVATALTGDDGQFSLPALPAGRYGLMAARRGYRAAYYNQHDEYSSAIVTGPGQDTAHVAFRLAPDAVLRGTVLDDAGEPVADAQVTVVRRSRSGGLGEHFEHVAAGNTDDQGLFEFWNLAPGAYFVAVRSTPWFATHIPTQSAKLTPEQQTAVAPLDVAYPVAYYDGVTDESAAAAVQLSPGDRQQIAISLHAVPALHVLFNTGRTSAETGFRGTTVPTQAIFGHEEATVSGIRPGPPGSGVVEIAGLAPGHYSVLDPTTQRIADLDASGSGTLEVNAASASPALHVDVTARMADGSRLPDQLQLWLVSDAPNTAARSTQQASAGHVRLDAVPPGSWLLNVWANGKPLGVVALEGRTGSHPGSRFTVKDRSLALTAVLEAGSIRVSGIALKDGKPVAGAMVVLVPDNPVENWPLFRRDQSDSDGSFNLQNVVPGRYTVLAIQDGWQLDWARPDVLARYLPRGQSVPLTRGSANLFRLPAPVPVQPR